MLKTFASIRLIFSLQLLSSGASRCNRAGKQSSASSATARMANSTQNSAVRKGKKLSLHIQKVWLFIKAKRIFPHSYFQPWSDLQPVRWRQIIRDAYLAVTLVFRLLNVVQLLQSRGQPFTRQDKVLCVCWKYSSIMSICK